MKSVFSNLFKKMKKKREEDIDEMEEIWHKKRKMNEDDIEELVGVVKERKERTKNKYKINRDGVKSIIIGMIGNFKSVYQISHWLGKIQSPQPLRSKKGNSKFETLLAKLFSLEIKNKITATIEKKIKFLLSKKTVYGSFR